MPIVMLDRLEAHHYIDSIIRNGNLVARTDQKLQILPAIVLRAKPDDTPSPTTKLRVDPPAKVLLHDDRDMSPSPLAKAGSTRI